MTPDFIWMVILSILGIALFIGVNMLVWHVYACLREEIWDGEGFALRKIFLFIPLIVLGVWKLFMFILMAVGAAAGISTVSDDIKRRRN